MLRCYITDRRSLVPGDTLLNAIARHLARRLQSPGGSASGGSTSGGGTDDAGGSSGSASGGSTDDGGGSSGGVDWIQIREKDLPARALFDLTQRALALANPAGVRIMVNTRADVAIAAGAAGLHLPGRSPQPKRWRSIAPRGFLIGVSCHDLESVRAAAAEGADYVLFGPVFAPLSKTSDLPPRGLLGLEQAAHAADIPVLALGGITAENARSCMDAGAHGIAAISLFQQADHAAP